jgi:ketohexokinase
MASILGIGVAVLDVILSVESYPAEDAKLRATARRSSCGGNAANTLSVLTTLGHRCGLAGALAADADGQRLAEELRKRNIDLSPARVHAAGSTPVSYILHSLANGSRTIVHHRTLPEFTLEDFLRIDLDGWDWLHFEGREVEATARMMEHALAQGKTISLEVEKPRPDIERLFPLASVLIFSREYAESTGTGASRFLTLMHGRLPGRRLFCAWGAEGAWTVDAGGTPVHTPPWTPPRIVDTLGAGDTFNAGIIDGLVRGLGPAETLAAACRLAGEKCGAVGLPPARTETMNR